MQSQKREDILAAALRMVSQHGFHGTSMAMIAAEAGTGAGTIYHYFSGKDVLMDDLFRTLKVEFLEAMMAGVSEDLSFRDGFIRMWQNIVSYVVAYPEKMAYLQQYHHSPYFKEDTALFTEAAFAPLIADVEGAMQRGELLPLPPAVFETLTVDVAVALAQRHVRGEIELTDDLRRRTALACWQAIQPGDSGS